MCSSVQIGYIYLFDERKGPGQAAGFITSALQVLSWMSAASAAWFL